MNIKIINSHTIAVFLYVCFLVVDDVCVLIVPSLSVDRKIEHEDDTNEVEFYGIVIDSDDACPYCDDFW